MSNKIPTHDEVLSTLKGIDPATGLQDAKKSAIPTDKDVLANQQLSNDALFGGASMGLNPDEFPFHLSVGSDNEELRAQNQTVGQQVLHGTGRFLGSTATKFLEGFGMMYGVGEAMLTDATIGEAVNNGWTNFWSEAEEGLKDQLPIYHTNKYKDGNVFQQMGTLGFWMDDVVDGFAFLASALIGSKGISVAGKGTGAYSALAKEFSKATRMAKKGRAMGSEGLKLKSMVDKLDLVTMSALNSTVEAGFEAKDTMDQLMSQGVSKEKAAEAARGTFLWNMGVLMVPNYITNSMFFGKVNPMSGRVKNLFKDGKLIPEVNDLTKAQIAGRVAGSAATSVTSEGAWEENIQLAVQNYFGDRAEGKDNRDQVEGIFSNWAKNWTTDEGQKAIALGAIIGLLPGGVEGYRKAKSDKAQEAVLHTLFGATMAAVKSDFKAKDIWETDETGKVIVDETTGEPIPSPVKLATAFVASHYTTQNAMDTLTAITGGDELMIDRLEEERIASLAYSHVPHVDGMDTFGTQLEIYAQEKIESMQKKGIEVDQEKLTRLTTEYKRKGRLYKTLFENVDQMFAGLYDFTEQSTGDQEIDRNLQSLARATKDNALLSQYMMSVDQMFWHEKVRELQKEIADINSTAAGETEIGKARVADIEKLIKAAGDQIKVSETITKTVLQESYWQKRYTEGKAGVIAAIEKKRTPAEVAAAPTVTEGDFVKVTDGQGKEYSFAGTDTDGNYIIRDNAGKEEKITREEAINRNITVNDDVKTPLASYTEDLKKKKAEARGTITEPGSTVDEEVTAVEDRIRSEFDEAEAKKARKEAVINELERRSAVEVTGAETEEEITRMSTLEILVDRYADPVLSDMTLQELFASPLKDDRLHVVFNEEIGELFIDDETNEVVFKSLDTNRETIVGKTTDSELFSGKLKVIDLGIVPIKHTLYDVRLHEDGVGIIIQGRRYVMDTELPTSAIKLDENGLPVAVTLKDLNGVPLTFTNPALVEELAYTLELLEEARRVAYETYLNEKNLDSDFVIVKDPLTNIDYHVYKTDSGYEILRPRVDATPTDKIERRFNLTFERLPHILPNGKTNKVHERIIKAYQEDIYSVMDKVAADVINAGNRVNEEDRKALKDQIEYEIKELIRNARSATAEDIVVAPGTSEVSAIKTKAGKTAKQELDSSTKGAPVSGEPDSGKRPVKEEVGPRAGEKGKIEAEIIEEKAAELAEKEKPKRGKGRAKESLGIEPDNADPEEDMHIDKHNVGGAHPATAVAYKAEDNPDLDKFLSDPNNDLKDFTLSAEIDYEFFDEDWTKAKHTQDYIKRFVNEVKEEEEFTELVDVIAIKLTLQDKNGKPLPYKGMYLHKSAFVEEGTLTVTEEQKEMLHNGDTIGYHNSREAMILEERRKVREIRKKVIAKLLKGEPAIMINLEKGTGVLTQTPGENRSLTEVTDRREFRFGVADRNGDIRDGKREIMSGRAGRGNVIWETTETANGNPRRIKLNVAKVSYDHARLLLKAYQIAANSPGGVQTMFKDPDVTGDLTVSEVINYLVLDGPITDQNNKDTNLVYISYLASKHLRLDTRDRLLYFGTQVLDLSKPIKKDQEKLFIDHITSQKNYAVPLAGNNKQTGTGLGGKIQKDFQIGTIVAKKGMTYEEFLVLNNLVLTDAKKDPVTGKLFSKPILMFEFKEGKAAKKKPAPPVEPVEEIKEETVVEEKPVVGKPTKEEVRAAESAASGFSEEDYPRLDSIKDFARLPIGTEIFTYIPGSSVLDDDDNVISTLEPQIHVIGVIGVKNGVKVYNKSPKTERHIAEKLQTIYGLSTSEVSLISGLFSTFAGKQIRADESTAEITTSQALMNMKRSAQEMMDDLNTVDEDDAPFAREVVPGPYAQGDINDAVKYLKRKFGKSFTPKIEEGLITVVRNGKNMSAWGTFERDAITLSKKLEKGTEYHEAFHRVSLLYLSPEQQQLLYKEARVRYGLKEATDREVNERLAEEYRALELSGGKIAVKGSKIKQFLTDLWDFIKTIFTGKLQISNLDIDNLFRAMGKSSGIAGRIWHAKPLPASYKALERGDVYTHVAKGRDLVHVKNTAQLTSIVKHLVFLMVHNSGVYRTKDINSLKYNYALRAMQNYRKNAIAKIAIAPNQTEKDGWTQLLGLYQEIIDNWDVYLDLIKNQLEALGIRTILVENPEENNSDFLKYDRASFETDSKDNAGQAIKLVIATLLASDELEDTLMSKFVDFDSMYDTLLEELSEFNTVEEMMASLKENSGSVPHRELLKKLENDFIEDKFDTLRTQFFHAMRKNRYNYRNALAKPGKTTIDIANAETQKMSAAQTVVWGQGFLLSKAFRKGTVDKAYVTGIMQDFAKVVNRVKREMNPKVGGIHNFKSFDEVVKQLIKIFKDISVPIDEKVFMHVLNNLNPRDKHQALHDFIFKTKLIPVFGNSGVFDRLLVQGTLKRSNHGGEIALDQIFKNERLFTELLAPAYIEVHGGVATNTILGPDGNPYYLLSDNSYLTDVFQAIRTNARTGLNHSILKGIEFNTHSYLLSQMADLEVRKDVDVAVFSALSIIGTADKGRGYTDLTDLEDALVKMAMFEKNLIVIPPLADRSQQYTITGLKALNFKYNYDENSGKLIIPKDIVTLFYGYAQDEYNEIQRAKNDIEEAVKNNTEHQLRENFHFKYNKEGKRDYKAGNGLKYYYFSEFNGKKYDLSEKASSADQNRVRAEIRRILEERIEDAIRKFGELGAVKVIDDKNGNLKAVTNLIFEEAALAKDSGRLFSGNKDFTLRNRIASFALNTMMAAIESDKLLFMNPNYYKNTDDKTKRSTVVASTGLTSRVAWPSTTLPDDRLIHNADTFITTVLNTQTFSSDALIEALHPKFVLSYMERGFSEEAAEKKAAEALSAYKEVDPTDAQAYITPAMFRALHIRLGEWNDAKESAYELVMSGKEINNGDQQKVDLLFMQPLKFVYFGPQLSPGVAAPLYYKMSMATLTPQMVKGTHFQHLYDAMNDQDNPIDMAVFDTAVKVGAGAKTDFYARKDDGSTDTELVNSIGLIDMPTEHAAFKFLRRQQVTDPHLELRDIVKTQFRKIALTNILDEGNYVVNGKSIKGALLKEQNKEYLAELSDRGVNEFVKLIGVDKNTMLTQDPDKLYNLVRTRARLSGMPDTLIDALVKQPDGSHIAFDAMPERKWVLSGMISELSKRTVDLELPGTSLVQMSSFGLRSYDIDDTLKMIDKDGYMEVKVSVEVFRNAIPNYRNLTEAERLDFAQKMFVGIGYRVPTQGLASTAPMRIVGFLPSTATGTIALPLEITRLTGSDFDIDKLYFMRHNYTTVKGKPEKVKFLTDDNSSIDERFELHSHEAVAKEVRLRKKALKTWIEQTFGPQKEEFRQMWAQLTDETDLSIVKDTDMDTTSPEFLKRLEDVRKWGKQRIVKEQAALKDLVSSAWQNLNEDIELLREQWKEDHINEFLERSIIQQNTKAAIENQLLDSYLSVQLNDDHVVDNYLPIDTPTSWLKDLAKEINAAEGVSEDYPALYQASFNYQSDVKHKYVWGKKGIGPFARANVHHILGQIAGIYLNTNIGVGNTKEVDGVEYTDLSQVYGKDKESILDWLSALINAHVDIAKDPYIFSLNVNNATYSVAELLIRAGAGESSFLFLAQPIIKEYAKAYADSRGEIRSSRTKPITLIRNRYKTLLRRAAIEEGIKGGIKPITDNIWDDKRLRKDIDTDNHETMAFYQRQLQILDKFQSLQETGQFLFQAVEATQVDTKKYGNNLSELRQFNHLVNKVLTDNVVRNMDKLFEATYIGDYYQNTVILGQQLFKDTTVMASDTIVALSDRIMDELGYDRILNQDGITLLNRVNDEIYAAIAGKFMVNELGYNRVVLNEMLYGDNSMVARLTKIKNSPRHADNPLLKLLQPSMSFKEGVPDIIITFTATDVKTKWAKDRIIEGWSELITDPDPSVSEFGRDLVPYTFFTSGFRKSLYTFFQFIPPAYMKEIGFSEFMDNQRVSFNQPANYELLESVHDDVFQNMSNDDRFVPHVEHGAFGQKRQPTISQGWDKKYPSHVSISDRSRQDELLLGYNAIGEPVYKPFIKTDGWGGKLLYKFIGYITDNEGAAEPVYELSQLKGYSEMGKVVKEYGLDMSAIPSNQAAVVPDEVKADVNVVGTREVNGKKKVTYDFSTFTPIGPEAIQIVTHPWEVEAVEAEETEEGEEKFVEQPKDLETVKRIAAEYTNHSGGALGADSEWDEIGREYGVVEHNHYFYGKQTPKGNYSITKQMLEEGWKHVLTANKSLHRRPEGYKNLLARNWFQVKKSDAVFAVAEFDKTKSEVKGGTGWAVQMAIDSAKPVYLFDTKSNKWMFYDKIGKKWVNTNTPTLTKNFAGIGTRGEKGDIGAEAKQAIRDVYEKTFGSKATTEPVPYKPAIEGATPDKIKEIQDKYNHCK